jgi:opacity protein-like surface antigen
MFFKRPHQGETSRLCLVVVTLLLVCVPLVSSPAAAQERHAGLYVGLNSGLSLVGTSEANDDLGRYNLKSEAGALYGLVLGYDLPPGGPLGDGRVELAYQSWSNDVTEAEFTDGSFSAAGSLSGSSLLLNSFATFPSATRWTPYVGLGLGVANIRLDQLVVDASPWLDDENLVLAGQAGCGLELRLRQDLRLDLGYRYFLSATAEFEDAAGRRVQLRLSSQRLLLGLAYLF